MRTAIEFRETPQGRKASKPVLCKGDGLCNRNVHRAIQLKHFTDQRDFKRNDAAFSKEESPQKSNRGLNRITKKEAEKDESALDFKPKILGLSVSRERAVLLTRLGFQTAISNGNQADPRHVLAGLTRSAGLSQSRWSIDRRLPPR